ncbi:ras-related protein Rab-3D-like isoform X2, partial [Clarias magur]
MASVNDSRLLQQPSQKDAADQNFDYMFKLLIIGNSSVGKTSFLFRYADDSFTSAFVSTVGIDFKVKTVFRNNKRIKLQIWDTAGQERYRTITTAYYRGAMGFLLMYDITNQDSYSAVQDWATQIKTYSWDNAQVILVGNKSDLEDDRIIPTEDSKRLADELGFQFFEASAKDNINVKQVFERKMMFVILAKHDVKLFFNSIALRIAEADRVIQLLRDEPENIKCFSETLRDFICFWEGERKTSRHGQPTFSFIYQYQNENSSVCAVSELPIQQDSGKRLFLCNIPKPQHFAPLRIRVFQGGKELYNRSLFIDHAVLLDPPANLTVVSTGKQGELIVSWLAPAIKYIDDSLIYEIRYVAEGSPMRKEIVKASTKFTLRGLQPSSKYKVLVRVKPDGITYDGYWSAWSGPEFGTTSPSDPLIVVLVLIISLILILLSLTVLLSHHKFLLKKVWPAIPSPEHKFPGLFTVYKGDFQ